MGPYSHFALAQQLITQLQPADPDSYSWGAIIPDIRYLAQMRRSQTHLPRERLREMCYTYPYLKSFLLGYQVHCLIDEIDVPEAVGMAFPLRCIQYLTRKPFSGQQIIMMVELYYLHAPVQSGWISGAYNEVLAELEIDPDMVWNFSGAMQQYIARPSTDTALAAFTRMGIVNHSRLDKYWRAFRSLENKPALKSLLFWSIRNARLDRRVTRHVCSVLCPASPVSAAV
jgi:hypothetical protein